MSSVYFWQCILLEIIIDNEQTRRHPVVLMTEISNIDFDELLYYKI